MKKKQRFCLAFRARVNEAIGAEQVHARFFASIKDTPLPWGLGDRPVPLAPEFGRLSSASIGLNKFFGDCVKRAMLIYRYRRMLSDDGTSDDSLIIDIDPAKVDLCQLTYTVIPEYVVAFDAYRVDYYDEQFVELAYATPLEQRIQTNPRFDVKRVEVVSFYDEVLCRRAFNLSPTDVLHRLEGQVEHARLLHTGVYVVGASRALPFNEAQQLSRGMTSALRG